MMTTFEIHQVRVLPMATKVGMRDVSRCVSVAPSRL